jgi:hypothetical protein
MLNIPLTQQQVKSAFQLHDRLKQWKRSDDALLKLRESMPEFSAEACLLKSIAVNALYGTQVLAIIRMADHICNQFADGKPSRRSPHLVERIAALPSIGDETPRRFVSFAAKFRHFFVHNEDFPIYDEAARDALKFHLGRAATVSDLLNPYRAFCRNLAMLRSESGINEWGRELDRYLWITGMYMKWMRAGENAKQQMNVELRRIFEKPDRDDVSLLDALLPASFERSFMK